MEKLQQTINGGLYMNLQPYQQQVIDDRDELAGKLAELTDFINSERLTETVQDELELESLHLQKSIMAAYLNVLNYRISTYK